MSEIMTLNDKIRDIHRMNKDELKNKILDPTLEPSIVSYALNHYYHELMVITPYLDIVGSLLTMFYKTKNDVLKHNIVQFLDNPVVLNHLMNNNKNSEIHDLIVKRLDKIWAKIYQETLI